jgi:hypothetical protein
MQLYGKYGTGLAARLLKRLIPALEVHRDAVIRMKYLNPGQNTTLRAKCGALRRKKKAAFLAQSYVGTYFSQLLDDEAGLNAGRLLER